MRILLLGLLFLAACTSNKDSSPAAPESLADHGARVYRANCIACHAADPKENGAVGPAIYGSSLELITARVMTASYPPGYKPKRESGQMIALPHLQPELSALHAFLNK